MLVFILPGLNPHLSENTAASVQSVFSDARHVIIPSEEVTAAILNETLAREFGPWFMTLYAGDSVQSRAKVEIEQWLRTCSDHSAGYIINPVSITDQLAPSKNRHVPFLRIPRGPLLWRTKTVMSGRTPGFKTREQLPFQKYVLNDKQFELSTRYEWMEVDSAGILYHQRAAPAWMKETEEWSCMLIIWNGTLFEGRLYEDIGQLMKLSNTHKLYHIPEALYHRRLRTSSLTHRHPHQYLEWKNSIIGESETWKHDHHSERQNAYE